MEVTAEIDDKIIALIAASVPGKFRKTKITLATNLQQELGLDSIGMLALVFRFEESFAIDIAQMGLDINIAKLKTVADLIQVGRDILSRTPVGAAK
jgi:acyl carrier protein